MPKHVPTFKHLVHTSQQPTKPPPPKDKSVSDLLTSSRQAQLASEGSVTRTRRDVPPHLTTGGTDSIGRIWSPSVGAAHGVGGLIDVEQGGIHPAEILRRSEISQRQASRTVAGPAPPPSWRSANIASTSTSKSTSYNSSKHPRLQQPVTTGDLERSTSLFSVNSDSGSGSRVEGGRSKFGHGRIRLVEYCFNAVLRHMEDQTIIYEPSSDQMEENVSTVLGKPVEAMSNNIYTLGRLLREQVTYLEPHLKSGLLATAAILPESHPERLTDRALLSILNDPPDDIDRDAEGEESWEDFTDSASITHLPLTLHHAPLTILRQLPGDLLHSLTSLNLAYCTLPNDMEKIIALLPPALRELSLVGISFTQKAGGQNGMTEEGVWRGFAALGRKLIVLRTLDLSYPRYELTPRALAALLHPGNIKLPSLRLLGLRGVISGLRQDNDLKSVHPDDMEKREWMDVVKGGNRNRYVEVSW